MRPHGEKVGVAIRAASGPSAQAVKVVAEEGSAGVMGSGHGQGDPVPRGEMLIL